MEPHVWERIQEVYHLALAVPPAQRNDLVVRACESDPILIQKVSSLLEAEASLSGFLEEPVCELALRIMSQDTLKESTELTNSDDVDGLINSTIGGRYLVESLLAEGGVARVYLARDLTLDPKRVVLKVLLERSLRNREIVRKFRREKDILAQVAHPGLVTILDAGELPDEKPYLVMEYVAGVSLRELIAANPEGLPFERAAFIIRGIGSALSAVHRNGIYHRDLKPENIMLQELGPVEEQVKVVDFGIAKVKELLAGPSPTDSVTMGTVAYMSPEQLRGDKAAAPSDVYSFAVVAYELLTGRRPFLADTQAHLLELQRQGIMAKPAELRPRLSAEAQDIILDGLAFEPAARTLGAGEFGGRLSRALLSDEQRVAPPALPTAPDSLSSRVDLTTNPDVGAAKSTSKARALRGRWPIYAAALVAFVLLVTAGYWFIFRNGLFSTRSASSLPHRTINYSLTVQKMRDGVPYKEPFDSSGQEIFESGYRFRLNISSRQAGYLYVFNEDATQFTVIYPTPDTNKGSARVEQNQDIQTNWNTFTGEPGTERLWIVWAQSKIVPLEFALNDGFKDHEGAIADASVAKGLKDFLLEHSKLEPETIKDTPKQRTTVRASGDLLVKLLELEHR